MALGGKGVETKSQIMLIPTFVEVTGEKTGKGWGGYFCPPAHPEKDSHLLITTFSFVKKTFLKLTEKQLHAVLFLVKLQS